MQRSPSAASAATISIPGPISGLANEPTTRSITEILRQAPPPTQELLRALVTAQAQHPLFLPDQAIVVAVSGGADSICLLHALHQLAAPWHLSLHVAHLDHALRPESADDATFVAKLAQQLALPFYSLRLTPGILDDDPRGQEAAARSARYAFLRQVANEVSQQMDRPVTLVTAHHQDDQAETLLLHLIQGSGLAGLAGMAWVGELPDAQQPPIRLVRPLLATSRAAIHHYLHSYGLPWREDTTNQDLAHLRNRLRHEVLPSLTAINPNIRATLARTADLLAAEADHAENRDRAFLASVTLTLTPSTRLVLDLFHLAQSDLATQRGVLRQALLALGIDMRAVGVDGINILLDQIQREGASGPHPLVAQWAWTKLGNSATSQLALHRADALPTVPTHPHMDRPIATPIPLPVDGKLTHNHWQLASTLLDPAHLPAEWRSGSQPWHFFGDADACGNLTLTTFHAGMQIAPLGMQGQHRALGDIFTDHKTPAYLRAGWPVILNDAGTVVWLCGLVVGENVRVHPATRQVRHLHWQLETERNS